MEGMIMTHAYLGPASLYACRDTVVNFNPGNWNRLEFKLVTQVMFYWGRACLEYLHFIVSFSFR
jgi:hypothetical protein